MSTTSFGKSIEMKIESELLRSGYKVYTSLADDHGVDCIIKNNKNEFIEIQIKGRSKSEHKHRIFKVNSYLTPIKNFYFIFYSENDKTTWVISSEDFCNITKLDKNNNNRK